MNPITPDTVKAIADALVCEASPTTVILFGSCARGEVGRDSDVDLLVVEEQPFGPGRSRFGELKRLRRSIRGFGVPIDLLLFSRDEVEKWKHAKNHIIAEALREGKVLYDGA